MDRNSVVLIIVYGMGSASPTAIAQAVGPSVRLVFVVKASDPHVRQVLRVLAVFGEVVDLDQGYLTTLHWLRRLSPSGIVTFAESLLVPTARLSADLGLLYHSLDVAERLTNKLLQRTLLNRAHLSSVATEVCEDGPQLRRAASAIGLPLIVKPLVGEGSRNINECRTRSEVESAARHLDLAVADGPWVVEQLIPSGRHPVLPWLGDYVSVESAVAAGNISHFCLTDKLPLVPSFRERGAIVPSQIGGPEQAAILDVASAAIACLGIRWGIVHTEIKLSERGPEVIEVNGRLGGGVATLMSKVSKVNPIRLATDISLGGTDLPPQKVEFTGLHLRYLIQPPIGRFRLVGYPSADEFRRLVPTLWSAEVRHKPGAIVDSRAGTLAAVIALHAVMLRIQEVEAAVRILDEVSLRDIAMETAV